MLNIGASISTLQQASLRNNLAWLRSFGCATSEGEAWVQVWHDQLDEFRALLLLPGTARREGQEAFEQVRMAIHRRINIYVDTQVGPRWRSLLEAERYEVVGRSVIKGAPVEYRTPTEPSLMLQPIEPSQIGAWSALYSKVFQREGIVMMADLKRWTRSLQCADVTSFFFLRDSQPVGIFQLCLSDDIAGLYSLGFEAGGSGQSMLRHWIVLIRNEVVERRLRVMYYERERRDSLLATDWTARGAGTLRVLRAYHVWAPSR